MENIKNEEKNKKNSKKQKKVKSNISFIQNNVDKNENCMYSCLQIAFEQKIDFVLFQEPKIDKEQKYVISHPAYYCLLPEN
jgi:hypothetical protein